MHAFCVKSKKPIQLNVGLIYMLNISFGYVFLCTYMSGGHIRCFLPLLSTLFFESRSFLEPEARQLDRLAS